MKTVWTLLLALALGAEPTVEQFQWRARAYAMSFFEFFPELMGCQEHDHAVDFSQCQPGSGRLNVKAYRKACRAARDLFELRGDC